MPTLNHLDVAEIFLQDSREALGRKALRTALSRAYYAAYHACVALFEYYGYRPQNFVGRRGGSAARWEHGIIVRRLLIEFTERRQAVSPDAGWGIRRLYADRILADYEVEALFEEVYVRESVQLAARIVSEVRIAVTGSP
ncbi:MAG: hypothetical protein HY695_24550 [Deltaproteobacteria bacterium]|nr:hypothetical protein [Deltaproteobacteria bacterium]